ncbi:unnamed protein product [Lactuca virosa]|uniref:Uncharacterized protein n=1 Tax=Lactuca virosa TaxID=75947 RepID=A0AAU9NEW5_9ASTR|nr:unnamed protein product [Lactuca virosa]
MTKKPSTKASTPSKTFRFDLDNEDIEDDICGDDDQTFHVSPGQDTTVESNVEETSIPDVTITASYVDTNIASSEPIITLILEQTSVTPPNVPIFKSNVEKGRT